MVRDLKIWLGNGILPFAAVSFLLAPASLFLWLLEWEEAKHQKHHHQLVAASETVGLSEEIGQSDVTKGEEGVSISPKVPDGNHSNRFFYPLLQMDTSYEMKSD